MMEYTLIKNVLTKESEGDYYAKHVNGISRSLDDLLRDVTGPGSILKETEVKAVLEAYWKQIMFYVSQGEEYRDDFLRVSLSILGMFENEEERFSHDLHEVNVSLSANKQVKQSARDIRPKYVDPKTIHAVIEKVYDWTTKEDNNTITPNGVIEVEGHSLKIFDHVSRAGIFFINKESGEETKVTHIRDNFPRSLSFAAPNLSPGKYKMEIRNSTRFGQRLRTGAAEMEFTVH